MAQDNRPLVSVLIPVYNRSSVVATINSVLQQTYENFEIVIVDNASTDNTVEEIKKINDSRIRIIVNEQNMGQIYSMNRGLKSVKGKYIARIDSDDVMLPSRLEKQVSFLEEHPECVIVGSHIRIIDDEDYLGPIMRMPISYEGFRFVQTFCCAIHHPTVMLRAKVIADNNLEYNPDLKMAADYDMWRRLLHYGEGCNLDEILVLYRRGQSNDSIVHLKRMIEESIAVRKDVCNELELNEKERKKMDKALKILDIENKSFFTTVWYSKFMLKSFKKTISKESSDYGIVKFHVLQKIFGTCIQNNKKLYARIINHFYNKKKSNLYTHKEKYSLVEGK